MVDTPFLCALLRCRKRDDIDQFCIRHLRATFEHTILTGIRKLGHTVC